MASRRFPSPVVIATGNPGKHAEWVQLLAPYGVEVRSRPLPSPEEDAASYAGNAEIKALAAASSLVCPALGDDVGLEVRAMNGGPGLETRRWAEAQGGWARARQALAETAAGSRATFLCALALAWPDGHVVRTTAAVSGHVVAPVGEGPGFEPCFVPEGAPAALPALDGELRSRFHHRHVALRQLAELAPPA